MTRQWRTPWLRRRRADSVYLRSGDGEVSICLWHVRYYFDIPIDAEVRFTVRRAIRSSKPREDEHIVSFGTEGWDLIVHSSPRRQRQESLVFATLEWMESVGIPDEEVLWLSCEYRTGRAS